MSCDPHRRARPWWLVVMLLGTLLGCRCTRLQDEVDGQAFTRCAQADAPAERTYRTAALELTIRGRALEIVAPSALRIAAFTGPVGAALEPRDLALLTRARPGLALYLGGLGDDERIATANLRALAKLRIPTLFLAGGADRWPVIEAAFSALDEAERDYVLQASGLREVRIGGDRFVLAAGAPLGRYAIDEHGCGLAARDLEAIQDAAKEGDAAARTWLVSWHAPLGLGLSAGHGGTELGSPDLKALAAALAVTGGLFAYPELQAAWLSGSPRMHGVPRLGRVGSLRADGSRVPSGVSTFVLTEQGLAPTP